MSGFLDNAGEIFDAATAAPEGSSNALTILIHPRGQIRIVDGAETPIESLRAQHGFGTAFRVTRNEGKVRVEGRSGSTRCVLEESRRSVTTSTAPIQKAVAAEFYNVRNLPIFRDQPLYLLTTTLVS